jgi:hypothetical protein
LSNLVMSIGHRMMMMILFIRFVGHDSPATLRCALKKRRRGQVNLAGAMAMATHSKTQLTGARVAGSGGGHR